MRPIMLNMTAFGPYATKETVDFRDAVKSGLFGIYGSTGSGKSTIFSAMTFALFGEASRNEQNTSSLRSHHAEDETLTKVEFVFEIGASRYLIRRTPDQMRPAKRGNGETKDTHKAWLFDVTGIEPEDITDDNCGKLLAEKKVGDVKAAVQERLGYGADQFRQIVLLPQGKFETFLTAKTDERMKILRDLFDVSLYRKLASMLKEEAKNTEDKVKIDRLTCANRLKHEGFESPDALKTGIAEAKGLYDEAAVATKAALDAAIKAETAARNGSELEAKFVALETAQTHLASLLESADDMKELEGTLDTLKKAKSLLDVDDAQQVAAQKLKDCKTQLSSAQSAEEIAKAKKVSAQDALTAQESLGGERDEQRKRVETLQGYADTLKKAGALKTAWQTAKTHQEECLAQLTRAKTVEQTIIENYEQGQSQVKAAQTQTTQRAQLEGTLAKAKQVEHASKAYAKAQKLHSDAKRDLNVKAKAAENAESCLDLAKTDYDQAERALSAVQAQHLAAKLVDGEPCSVCGSDVHPSPATGRAESAGLNDEFENAKAILQSKQEIYAKADRKLAAAQALLKSRIIELDELDRPELTAEQATKNVANIQKQLTALGPAVDLLALEKRVSNLSADFAKAKSDTEKKQATLAKSETDAALAKQSFEAALEAIPEPLRTSAALETETQSALAALKQMQAAHQKAQEDYTKAQEGALSAQKDVEGAQKALDEATTSAQRSKDTFSSRLNGCGLTFETYSSKKNMIDQIEELTEQVETYKADLAIAKDRKATHTLAVKERQRPDLKALHDARALAEEYRDTEAARATQLRARYEQLDKLLTSISGELARIEAAEAAAADLLELAALFNAQNDAKLDLETFAIGAMFDQVLQAANLRLQPMTSGRYSLEREFDGKGGGRRGLGIRVHDIHTGKARATSTLSGGETFIAALALALGLSDIVESVSGKIRLDTIFIDEGFGSLDTDNDTGTLDQVLQTLQDLVGANRAVGLISHVQLVQNAIPNGFFITKTASGSHVDVRSF